MENSKTRTIWYILYNRRRCTFQKQASQVHGLLQCPIHHRYWSERSKLWFHVLRSTICQINNPWYIEPILSRITSKQPGFLVLLIFHLYLNSIWTIFYKHLKEKKKKVLNLKLAYAWVTFNNSGFNFKLTLNNAPFYPTLVLLLICFRNFTMKGLDSFGYIIQAQLDVCHEQVWRTSPDLKTWILLDVEKWRMRLLRSLTSSLRTLCLS